MTSDGIVDCPKCKLGWKVGCCANGWILPCGSTDGLGGYQQSEGCKLICDLRARLAEAERERDELKAAIRKYDIGHSLGCGRPFYEECDCGRDAFLAALNRGDAHAR